MGFGVLIPILLLGAIALLVVALIRRGGSRGAPTTTGDGHDILVYALTAVAVGVFVFSLASLGRAAFPAGAFVFDPERQVATALAGIVVSAPFGFYLWRRLRERRSRYPGASGWTLYLSAVEALFTTSLAVTLFALLDWLISDGSEPSVTDVLVFGGAVVFHELASRATPPRSDAAELPRIIGTAIGLVPLAIGVGALIHWGLGGVYQSLTEASVDTIEPMTALAAVLTGGPVWWYRWLRPWDGVAGPPRNAWTFLVATIGLTTLLGSLVFLLARALAYLLTDTAPAGLHFEFVPLTIAVGTVAALIWSHHRSLLGRERTDPVRAYEYLSSAAALTVGVGALTFLVTAVFGEDTIVGSTAANAVAAAVALLAAFFVWQRFWSRAQRAPRAVEAAGAPRRFYLLGTGVVMSLVGSGALIATLVFVFQAFLGVESLSRSMVPMTALFLSAGGAAWHLLRTYAQDRDLTASKEVVTPFEVTVICSHPGMLAARFPKEARMRVLYRADEGADIDDEMAEHIVAAVDNTSSIVWVDQTGFKIAPAR